MAQYLDKVSIQTPAKNWRDFDLSCQQLTTQFFGRPNIAYAKEFPQAKIKCNLKSYARMQPLQKPVLGSVQVHNRAFFVPYRVVWDPWESFLVEAPYNTSSGSSIINAVPTITNKVIMDTFLENSLVTTVGVNEAYDFQYNSQSYVFTYFGRHCYKILRQLGYAFQFSTVSAVQNQTFSVMPILCWAKIFLDYYYPAQYAHSGVAGTIDGWFHRQFRYDMSKTDLMAFFNFTAWCYYKNDYFTAAWDSPVTPAAGFATGDYNILDITVARKSDVLPAVGTASTSGFNNPYGTPFVGQSGANSNQMGSVSMTRFTQYMDDSLKALTNYLKRHQLVGARVLERYLADFSVSLDAAKLKRSIYIGSQTFPIQFSDVMSNADTSDAVLGEYAGKGVAYGGDGNFEYDTDEFGMFIIINDVMPDIAYCQGLDRNVLHKSRLDFLNNEFEQLGTQPVLQAELAVNLGDTGQAFSLEDIFGFLPRYSEFKTGRDGVTGLFNYDSVNGGLLGWSTVRLVAAGTAHSIDFMRCSDAWQFARIFYGDIKSPESEIDKFFFVHRINIKVAMRAMPMYDTYDFDEDEGLEIKMQANGTQLN